MTTRRAISERSEFELGTGKRARPSRRLVPGGLLVGRAEAPLMIHYRSALSIGHSISNVTRCFAASLRQDLSRERYRG